jgi:pyocin large subunit-like protein
MGNYILAMAKVVRVSIALLLTALLLLAAGPGFRSRRQFDEHYAKHGREFGNISRQEYLERAQALRDAPAVGPILEAVTPDGIVSRFDRKTGYFGAYNPDRTIRTFFIPNAGERYFRRQAAQRGAE